MGLGQTLGEEAICDKNFVCRIENSFAESECSLFSISKTDFFELKESVKRSQLSKDFNMIEVIMRRNFFIKKHWRNESTNKN